MTLCTPTDTSTPTPIKRICKMLKVRQTQSKPVIGRTDLQLFIG